MFGETPRSKLSRSIGENPLARIILAGLGMGRQAVWTPRRYDQLSEAGYQNCMTVYACINQVARAGAGIEWKALLGEKDAPKHPILALLDKPNDNEGKRSFIAKYFSYLLLAGNNYIIAGRMSTQPPLMLWLARPDRMTILPGTGGALVGGYVYTVAGKEQKFEFAQVMHSRLFHPTNDFYGLSPLEVAGRGVDIVNMSAEWNMRLLQNDMRAPGALSTEVVLADETFKRLKKTMKEEWSGYENAGTPLLLEGGLKWVNFGMNPKDVDWLNSTKLTKRDICTVFNVDPCLIGDAEYATYSNKQEARKGLYQETVLPLMYELRDDLNRWLSPMFGPNVRLDLDRDKIEVLQEEREKKFAYLNIADWMTINEKRKATGLEEIGTEGDVILVGISKMPLEAITGEPAEPEPMKSKGAHKASFWTHPDRSRALWDNFVLRVKAKEKSLLPIAEKYLEAQARRAAENIHLHKDEEAKKYAEATQSWYMWHFQHAGNAGMAASKGELYVLEEKAGAFEFWEKHKKKLYEMIVKSGTKIAETTMGIIQDLIRLGESENWTTAELKKQVEAKLVDFKGFRAERIAQTETAKVENFGMIEGYRQTEYVDYKGWLCSFLPTSRQTHMDASDQEVALDEAFNVGGEKLDYPGDPAGSPGNIIECHCSTYPVVKGE